MGIRRGSISTPIIADGLIFNIDAANRASYPAQRTFAIAESGSCYNTLDLTQSGSFISDPQFLTQPTSASCWVYDGVDDAIKTNPLNLTGTAGSMGFWLKTTDTRFVVLSRFGISAPYLGAINGGTWYDNGAGSPIAYRNGAPSESALSTNTWDYYVFTNINWNADSAWDTTALSILDYNGWEFQGELAMLHIYNRTLSANEILHNYNALKGRFGS